MATPLWPRCNATCESPQPGFCAVPQSFPFQGTSSLSHITTARGAVCRLLIPFILNTLVPGAGTPVSMTLAALKVLRWGRWEPQSQASRFQLSTYLLIPLFFQGQKHLS